MIMPTGACVINCDVCRLNQDGICSSCGNGTSEQGRLKHDAQKRLLGAPCPLLACARLNRIEYCPRDCSQFPCDNFFVDRIDLYPFSQSYLAIQKRRRKMADNKEKENNTLEIPEQHWHKIGSRNIDAVARSSGAAIVEEGSLQLDVMNQAVRVDLLRKLIEVDSANQWQPVRPLTAFVIALYLAKCQSVELSGRWVSEKDLSSSEFFRGIHRLRTDAVINRYGHAPDALIEAAKMFGGFETRDGGDAALMLWIFPRIPLKLILWCGDDELESALTVMFDQSIDHLLPGDGIWALVQMVCEALADQRL